MDVTHPSGSGPIQLWDLETQACSSSQVCMHGLAERLFLGG